MPLSRALRSANTNPSLRTDWSHLLSGVFPQMLCLFLLLPCIDYSLLWGVVYILNLCNTLLETVVYIFPSYSTVIFSSTGAVSFVHVLGLDALCLLGGRCLLQSLERRRSLLPLRENNCLNETNFLFLLRSGKAGKKVAAGGHLGNETRWRETRFKGSLQPFQRRASPSHCRNALSCSPLSDLLEAPNITEPTPESGEALARWLRLWMWHVALWHRELFLNVFFL